MSDCGCNKTSYTALDENQVRRVTKPYSAKSCTKCKTKASKSGSNLLDTGLWGNEFIMNLAWNDEYDCTTNSNIEHGFPASIINWNPKDTGETCLASNPDLTWQMDSGYLIVRDTTIDGSSDDLLENNGQIVYKESSLIPGSAIGNGIDAHNLVGLCDAMEKCFDNVSIFRNECNDLFSVKMPEIELGECLEYIDGKVTLSLEGAQTNTIETTVEGCKVSSKLLYRSSSCINLEIDNNGLYAEPIFSKKEGNAATCEADGIYVPTSDLECVPTNIISSFLPKQTGEPNGIDFTIYGATNGQGSCLVGSYTFPNIQNPPKAAPDGYCWVAEVEVQTNGSNAYPLVDGHVIDVTMTVLFNGTEETYVGTPTTPRPAQASGTVTSNDPEQLSNPKLNASGMYNAKTTGNSASIKLEVCYPDGVDITTQDFCFANAWITGRYLLIKC